MRVLARFTNINSESLPTSTKGAPEFCAALSQGQSKCQLHLTPPVPGGGGQLKGWSSLIVPSTLAWESRFKTQLCYQLAECPWKNA